MSIDELPTPETDAFMLEYNRALASMKTRLSMWDKMESLERRLTIAREALTAIAAQSENIEHAVCMADKALIQTAPKP